MVYQLAGIGLLVMGVLIAIFGDKVVSSKQGAVGKAVAMPSATAKLVKWAIAIMLVWFGAALLIEGGPL